MPVTAALERLCIFGEDGESVMLLSAESLTMGFDVRRAVYKKPSESNMITWMFLVSQRTKLEENWAKGRFSTFQLPQPKHPSQGHIGPVSKWKQITSFSMTCATGYERNVISMPSKPSSR